MCDRCPKVRDPNAKGFWARIAWRKCECSCSGPDLQILQEQQEKYVGTDALGRQNFVPEFKTYAFCTKCRHKFRV